MPEHVVIMGAGPAGLASGYELTKNGVFPTIVERSPWVGGLARTIEHNGFRFDIGGHRWFTKHDEINAFFVEVLGDEMIWVDRTSRIYFDGKFFYYPLQVRNALAGMGIWRSIKAVADHLAVHLRPIAIDGEPTMEQSYVNQFGRTLYEQFFRTYSEKVWGLTCDQLSGDWVAQRSKGMSLTTAIKDAFSRSRGEVESLVDRFMYPKTGIGRFSELMADRIAERGGTITLGSRVVRILHDGPRITAIIVRHEDGREERIEGDSFISSIPLTQLVRYFEPKSPDAVREAANQLRFRDLITVNVMLDREQVTPDTWVYVHDKSMSFARFHEPRNWSPAMAPAGKTSLVCEVFCSREDPVWNADDSSVIERVISDLADGLNFISRRDVIDAFALRAVRAYPTYTMGYQAHLDVIKAYIKSFENLQIVGRYGTFRYNNTDHSVETGILAARNLLGEVHDLDLVNSAQEYLEEKRKVVAA